jgi:predicted nucleic acid-binding protein
MYLLDTNIWLERLLGQAHSDDVRELLSQISSDQLLITDFSFHSICLVLTKLKRQPSAIEFVNDLFVRGQVGLLSVPPNEIHSLLAVLDTFNLDFDDAYQYWVAERDDLTLVSFDSDFDRTSRRRKTPAQVVNRL